MDIREKLIELLADFFGIGSPDGSYHYILNRVKSAFGLGTMGLDDFEEYDEDTVAEIVEHLIDAGVTIPVRCKDCKHFKPIPGYTHVDGFCCYGGIGRVGKKETGYCNLGERRDDHG